MKKTITLISVAFTFSGMQSQTTLADFETFTLSPNSAYSSSVSVPFQTTHASFAHTHDFGLWMGGFAYTNVEDSVTAGFTNMYGVRAGTGYTNSSMYVVGQNKGVITLTAPNATVNGFYITNTTYAYKSMASGDQFARKFGDTTGTGSGTTIPQGSYPDFLKLTVKGFNNGTMINDSVEVYLADFTFADNNQDFILDTWKYVNTASLGKVDSIQFFMYSSDNGSFGINTPAYFAIDNFETFVPATVGIAAHTQQTHVSVYPNPFHAALRIETISLKTEVTLLDAAGKMVYQASLLNGSTELNTSAIPAGIYYLIVNDGAHTETKKIIKH